MRDKLAALFTLAFVSLFFIVPLFRYAHIVFFRGDMFLEQVKNNRQKWHKRFKFISEDPLPFQLEISRIFMLFMLLFCTPLFIIILWAALATLLK